MRWVTDQVRWRVSLLGILLAAAGCGDGGDGRRSVRGPSSFLARSEASGEITLTWDVDPDATSYTIYWDTSPGVKKSTASAFPGAPPGYRHTGLTDGTAYYYVVTATKGGRESRASRESSARPIAPPTGLVATPSSGEISLGWNTTPDATTYTLYWSLTPGVTPSTGNPLAGVTPPYPHTGLANGTPHHYVLTGENDFGGGAISSPTPEVSATPGGGAVQGVLDTTFGGLGWIVHHGAAGGNGDDQGTGIVVDGSGDILVTGWSDNAAGDQDMVVWRLLDSGALDTLFTHHDAAGGGLHDRGYGIDIDAQERIIVSGSSRSSAAGNWDLVIWRLDPTLVLDAAFAAGGILVHHDIAGGNFDEFGARIAVDPLDRIVVTGRSDNPSIEEDMVVCRYDAAGLPDTSFGSGGVFSHHGAAGGNWHDTGWDLAFDGTGGIFVCGWSHGLTANEDMVIWHIDSAGSLIPSFGGAGWIVHGAAAGRDDDDRGREIVRDPAGRIVVVGTSRNAADNQDAVLWAYDDSGGLDPSFGLGGIAIDHGAAGGDGNDEASSVILDAQGRILVAGWSRSSNGTGDMTIWRFNTDGSRDLTFGSGGVVTHDGAAAGSGWEDGEDITLDGQGRILVAGFGSNAAGDDDMVVWRYR
jgi:uncharacterized delta-60 repeat protein